MYKIMLADNEGIALDALSVMIDQEFGSTCDTRLAKNAHQVMDIFQKYQPNILFINVQMPGIHGISTIRDLHRLNRDCLFIVVSHKARLNYQREGTYLGVIEYLTKPVSRIKAVTAINTATERIAYERSQEQRKLDNKKKMETVVPILESGYVSQLLYTHGTATDLYAYRELLGVHATHGWLLTLHFCESDENGEMQNIIGATVQLQKQSVLFRRIVKAFFPSALIGPALSNRCVVVVPCKPVTDCDQDLTRRQERTAKMIAQMERRLNLRFVAELGNVGLLSTLSVI
ncbi:MAG: response regulator [Eubacteriales bacterium]|nr:response regulator [Eubacteriales bacterium]